jgi:hypothetical protein
MPAECSPIRPECLLQAETGLRLLRDVIARVVAAREEVEIGDGAAARAILSDLEGDLAVMLEGCATR